jgi:putative DNA primase/helicase
LKLIPFIVSFEGQENKKLKEELLKELPGILAWAVRGCLEWQKQGLGTPPAVLEATEEYRQESDTLAQFISDRCTVDSSATVSSGVLWEAYLEWAATRDVQPVSRSEFAKDLQRHDFEQTTLGHNKTRAWKGIEVRKGHSATEATSEGKNQEEDPLDLPATGPVPCPAQTGPG